MSRHPWVILSIVIAGLAAWMGLGTLHTSAHADSLLPVLISTQRWTPFFWGQDRFGMLVPLLAMPVHHPLGNLLLQGWIMTTAALLAPFVVSRFLTGRSDDWLAIGAGTNLLFLLITPPAVQYDWLVAQPYGISMLLAFAGLIGGDRSTRAGDALLAFFLLTLACWINIGIIVMIGIAAAVRVARPVRLLALEAAGAAVAALLAKYAASAHTVSALAPPAKWINGWTQLFQNSFGAIANPQIAIAAAVGAAIAIVWMIRRGRPSGRPGRYEPAIGGPLPWRTLMTAVAMAVGTWLVSGTSLWIGMNSYVFRYMYPTLMMAGVSAAILLWAPVAGQVKALSTTVLMVMIAVALVHSGRPSLGRLERDLDTRFGAQTPAILKSGATVIAGDYWRVWPAVFHANLTLAHAHSRVQVFGLTARSEATDALWRVPGQRVLIAAAAGDASAGPIADGHGVTVTLLEHRETIDLYTGQP